MKRAVSFLILMGAFSALFAQDFGFGPADDSGGQAPEAGDEGGDFGFNDSGDDGFGFSPGALKAGGEVAGMLLAYDRVFTGDEDFDIERLGDISGKLNVSLTMSHVDAFLNLRFDTDKLLLVDEAYARVGVKAFEAELGLRKLSWGRADSMGPLDVINPFDYSDLTDITNQLGMKIARPMVHVSYSPGDFTKLEGVFVPWFRAHNFDFAGRWRPSQMSDLESLLLSVSGKTLDDVYTDRVERLDHAQGGIRFTTTIGRADLGFQYYTGYFFRPGVNVIAGLIPPPNTWINVDYNRYHQIGVDYAQVLFGFNLRSELGVNLTSDLEGDDPAVENPAIVYSLGFDRNLFWGINLNLQGNGRIRLMQDNIALFSLTNPVVDVDAKIIDMAPLPVTEATPMTSTRITAILSKKFFRDELELKTTALWGIEDEDFLVIPAVVWTKNDLSMEVSAGFFGGDGDGELGQYRDNSYVKTVLTWKF
ncbi:MAG: hypothetical protein LBG26_00195 [Treponema sp.]|jgi:hypothetical protein|nr:hypothetical protein [Treponema sp.]